MTEINIPIWLFAVSAGVPCLSFMGLLLFLLRKIRKPYRQMLDDAPISFDDAPMSFREAPRSVNHPFRQDLLSMQIDAVFNGLNAIIESERIKINTLLSNGTSLETAPVRSQPQRPLQPRTICQPLEDADEHFQNLDEQIANLADCGGQPEEIADETGLSQAEVELALKMRSTRAAAQPRRLQAVA
jgi:hypothetical protein